MANKHIFLPRLSQVHAEQESKEKKRLERAVTGGGGAEGSHFRFFGFEKVVFRFSVFKKAVFRFSALKIAIFRVVF